jgi:hypothetical protein
MYTAKVAVAIAILSLIVTASASVYLYSSNQTALAQQKSAYDTQISALQGQISTIQTQLASAEQQESADSSAISSLQSSVTSIQTQLPTISRVPQATLVITNDVYNSENATFTFTVKNTQNYTVYAQLSATVEDDSTRCPSFDVYIYTSQIYNFTPRETISVPLNLTLSSESVAAGSYSNPACSSVNEAIVQFILPQSTAISPTYDFTVFPTYNHP